MKQLIKFNLQINFLSEEQKLIIHSFAFQLQSLVADFFFFPFFSFFNVSTTCKKINTEIPAHFTLNGI